MLLEILSLPEFPSSFNIEGQKEKFSNFGGNLPIFFDYKNEISKTQVIDLIRHKKHNHKTELLVILFWGIYFEVITKKSDIYSLLEFIESDDFEKDMNERKNTIIKSNNPSELFKSFLKEFRIPGLGYAYFTKLFFFYRQALVPEKQTYPILDKWLSNAWCALDGSMNKNTEVYNRFYKSKKDYFFDGTLKREKPQAYDNYAKFMSSLAENRNGDVIFLEEKLFGAHIGKHPDNNPRHLYRFWAEENDIPLKRIKSAAINKSKTKDANKNNKNAKGIKPPFFLIKRDAYTAIRIEPDNSQKVGYVTNSGLLHVSNILKKLLEPNDLDWKDATSDGGTKEKYKTQFDTKEDCIEYLKNKGILNDS